MLKRNTISIMSVLKAGRYMIAVRVEDTSGGGGDLW